MTDKKLSIVGGKQEPAKEKRKGPLDDKSTSKFNSDTDEPKAQQQSIDDLLNEDLGLDTADVEFKRMNALGAEYGPPQYGLASSSWDLLVASTLNMEYIFDTLRIDVPDTSPS